MRHVASPAVRSRASSACGARDRQPRDAAAELARAANRAKPPQPQPISSTRSPGSSRRLLADPPVLAALRVLERARPGARRPRTSRSSSRRARARRARCRGRSGRRCCGGRAAARCAGSAGAARRAPGVGARGAAPRRPRSAAGARTGRRGRPRPTRRPCTPRRGRACRASPGGGRARGRGCAARPPRPCRTAGASRRAGSPRAPRPRGPRARARGTPSRSARVPDRARPRLAPQRPLDDAHRSDPCPGTKGGLWWNGTRFSHSAQRLPVDQRRSPAAACSG